MEKVQYNYMMTINITRLRFDRVKPWSTYISYISSLRGTEFEHRDYMTGDIVIVRLTRKYIIHVAVI